MRERGAISCVLVNDINRRMTTGIVIFQTSQSGTLATFAHIVKEARSLIGQPMLVAIILAEMQAREAIDFMSRKAMQLDRLGEILGQHRAINRYVGDPQDVNHPITTRILNSISNSLSISKKRLDVIPRLLEVTETLANPLADNASPSQKSNFRVGQEIIKRRRRYLTNICKNGLLEVSYNQRQVDMQLAVVGRLSLLSL